MVKFVFILGITPVLFLAALWGENKIGAVIEIKKERGNLYERVEAAGKKQIPKDSDEFHPPTTSQQNAWRRVVEKILRSEFREAQSELQKVASSYELFLFTDEASRREYVILQEKSIKTGWGFYVFDLQSKNPLTIEITHPVADARTELEGIDAFLQTGAQAFLMAGAHRRANKKETKCTQPGTANNPDAEATDYPESDVAHNTETIFQTTHEALVNSKPQTVVVQLHGMVERQICPNVFVSSGTRKRTANTSQLFACLTGRKVEAAVYEGNADGCPLGATTNVQGRYSNGEKSDPCNTAVKVAPEPGRFIHIEQEPSIRRDRSSWQPVIEALKCAFPN